MAFVLKDWIKESTITTGTGTLTLAGAVAGATWRTFGDIGNTNVTFYCIYEVDANGNPSGAWERGVGTYTTSGTTLSRDKILSNSSGGTSAINFGAGTKHVICDVGADTLLPPNHVVNGRLTVVSGDPCPTTDQTAKSTIYFTPYNGNRITLWNGYSWRTYLFTEFSLALSSLTSGKNYDVFVYDNAGTLTLELSAAWTNDSTRADAIALQDGVYCKSADKTRRYIGTIRTTGTTTTEDSLLKRFVWNAQNRLARPLCRKETTANWSYNSTTIRQANGSSANQVEAVLGLAISMMDLSVGILVNQGALVGIGEDTTTAFDGLCVGTYSSYGGFAAAHPRLCKVPDLGYHYWSWNEQTTQNAFFYATDASVTNQAGLIGHLDC